MSAHEGSAWQEAREKMSAPSTKAPVLKSAMVRPRVIIGYPSTGSTGVTPGKTIYAAGCVEGYSGSDILIDLPMGRHSFSRADGTWREGDCLNYKDAKILDIESVEASIKGGHGGDVEEWRKSLPMCAEPEQA